MGSNGASASMMMIAYQKRRRRRAGARRLGQAGSAPAPARRCGRDRSRGGRDGHEGEIDDLVKGSGRVLPSLWWACGGEGAGRGDVVDGGGGEARRKARLVAKRGGRTPPQQWAPDRLCVPNKTRACAPPSTAQTHMHSAPPLLSFTPISLPFALCARAPAFRLSLPKTFGSHNFPVPPPRVLRLARQDGAPHHVHGGHPVLAL